MLPDKDVRVKTASPGVDKYCLKMKEWLERVRKRIADRKAQAASTSTEAVSVTSGGPAAATTDQ